jgi:hypothetical protein
MSSLKALTGLFLLAVLAACSGVEVQVGDPAKFAAGNFKTYSWRSEPFTNSFYSKDPVYIIDPVLRRIVNQQLIERGFQKVARGGDFTVDYTYAPGMRIGVRSDAADNLSPRAGVRPNTTISQAERDNAIALSGVRETRDIALQINDGRSGLEIWQAVITKFVTNVNEPDKGRLKKALKSGLVTAMRDLPAVGQQPPAGG